MCETSVAPKSAMVSITPELVRALKSTIDSYTSKPNGLPGVVYKIINKDGTTVFEHASGLRGLETDKPMTLDTVFSIASCTKLITAIAAMQLVEQGKLDLDSERQVDQLAPELRDVKVLDGGPDGKLQLVEKKTKITLRMLLTHTAGFSYSFANPKLKKWYDPIGIFESDESTIFGQPLVNQPGEKFEYGVNMDWAGRLVERVSGLSLDEYCQKFIMKPLRLSETTYFPSQDMKERLAFIHERKENGNIQVSQHGHLFRQSLLASTPEEIKATVNSGGGGMFSTVPGYCEILATLLNHGTHPKTGTQILKRSTVDEMLKNQLPDLPDFARNLSPPAKPYYVNGAPEMYPQQGNPPQGWGLSFFKLLEAGPTGRSTGSVFWSGLFNLIWWVDFERGIAGMIASQILPFGGKSLKHSCQSSGHDICSFVKEADTVIKSVTDPDLFMCQAEVEAAVYAEIAKA